MSTLCSCQTSFGTHIIALINASHDSSTETVVLIVFASILLTFISLCFLILLCLPC